MVSDGKSFEYFNTSSILTGGYFDKKSEGINLSVKLEKFYVKKEISNRCYVNVIAPMFKILDIDGSGEDIDKTYFLRGISRLYNRQALT